MLSWRYGTIYFVHGVTYHLVLYACLYVVVGVERCWFLKELNLLNAGEKLIYTMPEYRSENMKSVDTVHE
jgi:hypothetical protein